MNKIKIVQQWLLITGCLIILLGLAHLLIAVPLGIEAVKSLPRETQLPLTMSNIVTALAVGLAGLLIIYCAFGIKRSERWAWIISFSTGLIISVIGIGYIFITPDNPFAYLVLVIAISELAPLCFYRKSLQLH